MFAKLQEPKLPLRRGTAQSPVSRWLRAVATTPLAGRPAQLWRLVGARLSSPGSGPLTTIDGSDVLVRKTGGQQRASIDFRPRKTGLFRREMRHGKELVAGPKCRERDGCTTREVETRETRKPPPQLG
jgi:hypothetical protein